MRSSIIIATFILISQVSCEQKPNTKELNTQRFAQDTIDGVYIPKDLEDCFVQIDSFWDDSTKTQVKRWTEEGFSSQAHFGFGLWMRNNWGLRSDSRLSEYFNNLGIYNPDDMSGIILDSYYRYLTGQDIKLDEQVRNYKSYW